MCQVDHYEFSETNLNLRDTMTNQQILANGPEGWTHFDGHHYYKESEFSACLYSLGEWVNIFNEGSLSRSRSDIERIVYLESKLKGEAA